MKFSGKVIRGDGYGKTLGFPTANIDSEEFLKTKQDVKLGVYAGFVVRESTGMYYRAGIVVSPLDKNGIPKLEAHLLDFDGDLYGETLTFTLSQYLRPFEQYETEEELKEAINADIVAIIRLALPKS